MAKSMSVQGAGRSAWPAGRSMCALGMHMKPCCLGRVNESFDELAASRVMRHCIRLLDMQRCEPLEAHTDTMSTGSCSSRAPGTLCRQADALAPAVSEIWPV